MKQIRNLTDLYDNIEKEYAWRITELSNYRNLTLNEEGKKLDTLIRAGITLLYAHWEGFIKKSSDLYYSFVINQSHKISELNNSFISIALRNEINELQSSKKLKIHNNVVNTFFNQSAKIPNFSNTSPIRTSNLKYEIFEDVCLMIGVDINEFHIRYRTGGFDRELEKYIDETLLNNRNTIAHGNYLIINKKEFKEIYDVIVKGLLYSFKELLMDCAQNKKYLKNG